MYAVDRSFVTSNPDDLSYFLNNMKKSNGDYTLEFQYVPNSFAIRSKKIDGGSIKLKYFKFYNGFQFVLGFNKDIFHYDSNQALLENGPFPPQLYRAGSAGMYIYGNICSNMQVGDTFAPLLRHVAIVNDDDEKTRGNIRLGKFEKIILDYPMYVPLSRTSINSIDIEIRTNKGDYFPFTPNSVTTLTLHFLIKNG